MFNLIPSKWFYTLPSPYFTGYIVVIVFASDPKYILPQGNFLQVIIYPTSTQHISLVSFVHCLKFVKYTRVQLFSFYVRQ